MLKTQKATLYDTLKQPFFGTASLTVNINKYYTDVDGAIIAKATAPAALKNPIPIFMLGNFDRNGGYGIGQRTLSFQGAYLLMTYVHGVGQPFLWDSGLNTVQSEFVDGDIITVFTDSISAPTGFVFIQQTISYGGLSSVLENNFSNIMKVNKIALQVDNEDQLSQGWQIVRFDPLGLFQQEGFNIIQFRPTFYKLTDFIELALSFDLTPMIGINFLMTYTSDLIQVNFKVTK
jgi:hypothetical protein